ncbi:hypothetical protein VNO77_14593 [Canavalia gladiata]|uniref:MCM C-terminal AAA(+) ATPase domain-containing protein n=1 Tax=Canavalia gladiata TaxID=3824 RepID=A0AAN9LZI1_CANGL
MNNLKDNRSKLEVEVGKLSKHAGVAHRKLKEGMKIRGDLHICLMGDPGVAKSQLLKHIINVAPRGCTPLLNPLWGRYDLRRTPAKNINLPPTLLSRFDLLWLILDRADMDNDLEMARHVVYTHKNKKFPVLGFTPIEPSILRACISAARSLSPSVPRELEEYIASAYFGIHQEEEKSNTPHYLYSREQQGLNKTCMTRQMK